jgi:putative transposase
MKKRWTADQIARMLNEADRELAKRLTVPDVCRKIAIARATYYRWRQRHDPARVSDDRRRRELELEVERSSSRWPMRGRSGRGSGGSTTRCDRTARRVMRRRRSSARPVTER